MRHVPAIFRTVSLAPFLSRHPRLALLRVKEALNK
jgi:hypothetical protein